MRKFFNILNRKFTVGNVSTIIASFIFAIIIRQLYLHYLEILPVKGELEALDISFFAIVVLFRFILSAFLEYLLEDKFYISFFETTGGTVGQKSAQITTLSMVNTDNQEESSHPPKDNPFKPKNDMTRRKIEESNKFIDKVFEVGEKMWNVLMEQEGKIHKLHEIKARKNVEFYEENGNLDISVPQSMTDAESQKLSKEIGAIDRSLQNKFSEYRNLSNKDAKLYQYNWTSTYKETENINKKQYKELFDKKK